MTSIEELKKELCSLSAGREFVEFSKKVQNTKKTIIGVKVPALRKVAKTLESQPHEFIFSQDGKVFELTLLEGMMISKIRNSVEAKKRIDAYLKKVDSWALVDLLFPLAFVSCCQDDFEYFCSFLGGDEFFARFGIVGLLKYFAKEKDYMRIIQPLNGIKCEKYYVLMAAAWLLSEILIQNSQNAAEIMQKIIKNTQINSFALKKAVQKACDSYRVSSKTKEELKKIRL